MTNWGAVISNVNHTGGSHEDRVHNGKRLADRAFREDDFQGFEQIIRTIGMTEVQAYAIERYNAWIANAMEAIVKSGSHLVLDKFVRSRIVTEENREAARSRRDEAIAIDLECKRIDIEQLIQNGLPIDLHRAQLVDEIVVISTDLATTEANRSAAGKILIQISREYGGYCKLLQIAMDSLMSSEVRQIAASLVNEAVIRAVDVYFDKHSIQGLKNELSDERLERALRERAAQKMVARFSGSTKDWVLDEISKDNSWPKFVREMAGTRWAQIVNEKKMLLPAAQIPQKHPPAIRCTG